MYEETTPQDTTEEAAAAEETAAALLTAEKVAERLGISTRRLRDWRKDGRITEVGRFKRGTAKISLFDPADIARLQRAEEAEEAPAAVATVVATPLAFAEAVAQQVAHLLAERAEAEAVAVAPLVALVREQQETIDELRRQLAEATRVAQAAPQPRSDTATPSAHNATPLAPAPAGGFWQRVRRVFGEEGERR